MFVNPESNHTMDGHRVRLMGTRSRHLFSRGSLGSRALGVTLTLGEFLFAGALAFELELFLLFALLHHLLDAELLLLLLELLLLLALLPLALQDRREHPPGLQLHLRLPLPQRPQAPADGRVAGLELQRQHEVLDRVGDVAEVLPRESAAEEGLGSPLLEARRGGCPLQSCRDHRGVPGNLRGCGLSRGPPPRDAIRQVPPQQQAARAHHLLPVLRPLGLLRCFAEALRTERLVQQRGPLQRREPHDLLPGRVQQQLLRHRIERAAEGLASPPEGLACQVLSAHSHVPLRLVHRQAEVLEAAQGPWQTEVHQLQHDPDVLASRYAWRGSLFSKRKCRWTVYPRDLASPHRGGCSLPSLNYRGTPKLENAWGDPASVAACIYELSI
mmetsp:Transcript_119925/g.290964  ORF Transcript_119925/g.290964 Transcript_119925/m.290964 type:complete len:385 (-) Transcript_119925:1304-2458(-)